MAVSWFLLLVICVMVVVLLAVNVYVLVHYSHPDDSNEAWLPKILVILGLLLAESCILALPLDVANNASNIGCQQGWINACGGLNMYLFWEIMYVVVTLLCVVILPFAIFYYESDDGLSDNKMAPVCTAVKYTLACVFVSGLILGLCYFFIGKIRIPIVSYAASLDKLADHHLASRAYTSSLDVAEVAVAQSVTGGKTRTFMTFTASFIVYMIALVSFVGWFLFTVFGGVGLAALPMEMITAFTGRVKPLTAEQLAHEQLLLQTRVADLIEVGQLVQKERKERRSKGGNFLSRAAGERGDRSTVNKFKQMVYLLEEDYDKYRLAKDMSNYNPLYPFFMLVGGILAAAITFFWVIHVIVYMFFYPPQSLFLNEYFIQFDGYFPLFGVMSVAIFAMYLLFAVVAGNFKLGVRFLCITLHPMKINGTYMNSFLFNLILILLCTFPAIEFSTEAFAGYSRFSNIYHFFGVQIKYLVFFSYFFANNVFVYTLLGFTFLSTIYFLITPRDKALPPETLKTSITRRRKGSK